MTKQEYLQELRAHLGKLPPQDAESAISYYNEYFDEAGVENFDRVAKELGAPAKVAAQILAQSAVADFNTQKPTTKSSLRALWLLLLAIFASPIALPLAIVFFALILVLVIALICVFVSLLCGLVGLLFGGLFAFVSGFALIGQSLPSAALYVGGGLVCMTSALLLAIPLFKLIKATFVGLAKLIRWIFVRRKTK